MMSFASRLCALALLSCVACILNPASGSAETRRAFVVGITKYKDAGIQQLSLATQDAEDIARDLKDVGFQDKNIKLYNNPATRDAFLSEFNKFVETVKEGDVVFFYFSGHGYGGRGADGQAQNYLLFGDVKSPIEFARGQATDSERKIPQLLAARAENAQVRLDYETIEVPARGISEKEILSRLEQKKPRVAIIVIDACRTLLSNQSKGVGRVGTNLTTTGDAPRGFMLIYSARHGQQAIEKFRGDEPRNSLFTSVFREFLTKPGLDLVRMAKRVQDMVSQIASNVGQEQDPDYVDGIRGGDFYLIEPIGGDRFVLNDNPCDFAAEDMREIRQRPRRDRLDRHLRYFPHCPTEKEARILLDVLAHGSADGAAVVDAGGTRTINACDRLAASEEDSARPSDVSGVRYDQIAIEPALAACSKAIDDNPRVVRYLFNLARVYQRKALLLSDGDAAKAEAQRSALLRYQDAVARGYVAAFNNLAIMYDNGEGVATDPEQATRLFRQGAEQGHPIAMYNLALRYRHGRGGLQRNFTNSYEWFAKAAEAGNVGAMVQVGVHLWCGCGTDRGEANPVRAIEWLRRAANAGSNDAKRELGFGYFFGRAGPRNSVQVDRAQSLLWFAQAAESGDAAAQRLLGQMFEDGLGLASQQPQIAERYWRLAAYGGDVLAQVEFAERILSGRMLIKPENGAGEVAQLLKRAMTLGSSKAALRLAQIYRKGELGYAVRPEEAVKYAYRAIDLATQAGGSNAPGATVINNPLDEISAGILLAEMAANKEAVNTDGQPLLTQDERERLERYYGRPDPETKAVKVRSLQVWMRCGLQTTRKYFWLWDWGREEAPTEAQFRYYEAQNPPCRPHEEQIGKDGKKQNPREVLKALWEVVRKDNRLSFPEVVAAQAEAASATASAPTEQQQPASSRRRR